jgi:GTP-binding protein
MLDLVCLFLQAGDGGDGKVSFFRSRRVLKGGPDGGNGGTGGNVIIELDHNLNTLQHLAGKKRFIASRGFDGGRAGKEGAQGESITLKVPQGTVIWLWAENQVSAQRRTSCGLTSLTNRTQFEPQPYFLQKATDRPPARAGDDLERGSLPKFVDFLNRLDDSEQAVYAPLTQEKLLRLSVINEKVPKIVLCQGGFGGRGNDAFKGPADTTPLHAEYGTFGEQKIVFLELRLLADIGLVGLPNAGKSSLLRRLTSARPKVADYPFTTLEPHLGVWEIAPQKSLVLADVPGLIAGASQGKGLGFTFLRHLQNTRELFFLLALSETEVYAPDSVAKKSQNLLQQFRQLQQEVISYSPILREKKFALLINKVDLYSLPLRTQIAQDFKAAGHKVYFISVATGEGLAALPQLV